MTSKNEPIRTLFEESWLWVINLALRTRTPGGRGVGSMQTTVNKGGRLLWMAPNGIPLFGGVKLRDSLQLALLNTDFSLAHEPF